jgi:hypothetical protein
MIRDIVSFLVSLAKNKFVIPAKNKLFSLTYTFVSNINYKNLISYTDLNKNSATRLLNMIKVAENIFHVAVNQAFLVV